MSEDEQAIRAVIEKWRHAAQEGDIDTLETLMSEDVIFLLPGADPIQGREAFLDLQRTVRTAATFTATIDVREVSVHGRMAYAWSHLTVDVNPASGAARLRRSGHTLTIFLKEEDGSWLLARDANLLTTQH